MKRKYAAAAGALVAMVSIGMASGWFMYARDADGTRIRGAAEQAIRDLGLPPDSMHYDVSFPPFGTTAKLSNISLRLYAGGVLTASSGSASIDSDGHPALHFGQALLRVAGTNYVDVTASSVDIGGISRDRPGLPFQSLSLRGVDTAERGIGIHAAEFGLTASGDVAKVRLAGLELRPGGRVTSIRIAEAKVTGQDPVVTFRIIMEMRRTGRPPPGHVFEADCRDIAVELAGGPQARPLRIAHAAMLTNPGTHADFSSHLAMDGIRIPPLDARMETLMGLANLSEIRAGITVDMSRRPGTDIIQETHVLDVANIATVTVSSSVSGIFERAAAAHAPPVPGSREQPPTAIGKVSLMDAEVTLQDRGGLALLFAILQKKTGEDPDSLRRLAVQQLAGLLPIDGLPFAAQLRQEAGNFIMRGGTLRITARPPVSVNLFDFGVALRTNPASALGPLNMTIGTSGGH